MKTPATKIRFAVMLAGLIFWLSVATTPIYAGKKKKEEAAKPSTNVLDKIDYSKLVWPNPPAPTRVKYLNYFCCDKYAPLADKKKSSWMDRMAGGETEQQRQMEKPLFALWTPYGLAVDSKGSIYIADGKVGAIFIFNTETKELQMIKHGRDAHFGDIIGLAIDDSDRLFVSDTKLHHIVVFDKNHKVEGSISEGVVDPGGMAIDNENRFLYVADPALDQVLVYDADKLTLIRKIGTAGKKHTLTAPGQFSVPTNVAVDADGNLYVTDMYNNRVEVFDADGNFIRAWGKAGDRPGTFSRPKGIAIDADGHVWVADAVMDILQCYTPEGQFLMWMGGHGLFPGQFRALAGLYIDKNNRMFASEQYPGRVQMFRYFTDDEAREQIKQRHAEVDKKRAQGSKPAAADAAATAPNTNSTATKPQ
ncbi:MAG TPA: SMP-30/gluconolactonase/LRE family protein [Candidatus Udaeobacter sp.]|jgi:sugar lactone lactonase YvrE|nr:SMP-30/gluconolactonase/LRE family protein [Candidatus Udaeobacter sp.]